MNDHYHGRDLLNLLLKNNVGFAEGNIMKYVFRWKDKGGIDDLKKAKDYLISLIEEEEIKARHETFTKEDEEWMLKSIKYGQILQQSIQDMVNTALTKLYISPLDYQVSQEKLQEK